MRVWIGLFALLGLAISGCGDSGGSGGSSRVGGGGRVVKGSVDNCPEISGLYDCAVTEGEDLGSETRTEISHAQDANGVLMFSMRSEDTELNLIADGEVQEVKSDQGVLRYAVTCSESAVKVHLASEKNFNVQLGFSPHAQGLQINASGTVEGKKVTQKETCTRI